MTSTASMGLAVRLSAMALLCLTVSFLSVHASPINDKLVCIQGQLGEATSQTWTADQTLGHNLVADSHIRDLSNLGAWFAGDQLGEEAIAESLNVKKSTVITQLRMLMPYMKAQDSKLSRHVKMMENALLLDDIFEKLASGTVPPSLMSQIVGDLNQELLERLTTPDEEVLIPVSWTGSKPHSLLISITGNSVAYRKTQYVTLRIFDTEMGLDKCPKSSSPSSEYPMFMEPWITLANIRIERLTFAKFFLTGLLQLRNPVAMKKFEEREPLASEDAQNAECVHENPADYFYNHLLAGFSVTAELSPARRFATLPARLPHLGPTWSVLAWLLSTVENEQDFPEWRLLLGVRMIRQFLFRHGQSVEMHQKLHDTRVARRLLQITTNRLLRDALSLARQLELINSPLDPNETAIFNLLHAASRLEEKRTNGTKKRTNRTKKRTNRTKKRKNRTKKRTNRTAKSDAWKAKKKELLPFVIEMQGKCNAANQNGHVKLLTDALTQAMRLKKWLAQQEDTVPLALRTVRRNAGHREAAFAREHTFLIRSLLEEPVDLTRTKGYGSSKLDYGTCLANSHIRIASLDDFMRAFDSIGTHHWSWRRFAFGPRDPHCTPYFRRNAEILLRRLELGVTTTASLRQWTPRTQGHYRRFKFLAADVLNLVTKREAADRTLEDFHILIKMQLIVWRVTQALDASFVTRDPRRHLGLAQFQLALPHCERLLQDDMSNKNYFLADNGAYGDILHPETLTELRTLCQQTLQDYNGAPQVLDPERFLMGSLIRSAQFDGLSAAEKSIFVRMGQDVDVRRQMRAHPKSYAVGDGGLEGSAARSALIGRAGVQYRFPHFFDAFYFTMTINRAATRTTTLMPLLPLFLAPLPIKESAAFLLQWSADNASPPALVPVNQQIVNAAAAKSHQSIVTTEMLGSRMLGLDVLMNHLVHGSALFWGSARLGPQESAFIRDRASKNIFVVISQMIEKAMRIISTVLGVQRGSFGFTSDTKQVQLRKDVPGSADFLLNCSAHLLRKLDVAPGWDRLVVATLMNAFKHEHTRLLALLDKFIPVSARDQRALRQGGDADSSYESEATKKKKKDLAVLKRVTDHDTIMRAMLNWGTIVVRFVARIRRLRPEWRNQFDKLPSLLYEALLPFSGVVESKHTDKLDAELRAHVNYLLFLICMLNPHDPLLHERLHHLHTAMDGNAISQSSPSDKMLLPSTALLHRFVAMRFHRSMENPPLTEALIQHQFAAHHMADILRTAQRCQGTFVAVFSRYLSLEDGSIKQDAPEDVYSQDAIDKGKLVLGECELDVVQGTLICRGETQGDPHTIFRHPTFRLFFSHGTESINPKFGRPTEDCPLRYEVHDYLLPGTRYSACEDQREAKVTIYRHLAGFRRPCLLVSDHGARSKINDVFFIHNSDGLDLYTCRRGNNAHFVWIGRDKLEPEFVTYGRFAYRSTHLTKGVLMVPIDVLQMGQQMMSNAKDSPKQKGLFSLPTISVELIQNLLLYVVGPRVELPQLLVTGLPTGRLSPLTTEMLLKNVPEPLIRFAGGLRFGHFFDDKRILLMYQRFRFRNNPRLSVTLKEDEHGRFRLMNRPDLEVCEDQLLEHDFAPALLMRRTEETGKEQRLALVPLISPQDAGTASGVTSMLNRLSEHSDEFTALNNPTSPEAARLREKEERIAAGKEASDTLIYMEAFTVKKLDCVDQVCRYRLKATSRLQRIILAYYHLRNMRYDEARSQLEPRTEIVHNTPFTAEEDAVLQWIERLDGASAPEALAVRLMASVHLALNREYFPPSVKKRQASDAQGAGIIRDAFMNVGLDGGGEGDGGEQLAATLIDLSQKIHTLPIGKDWKRRLLAILDSVGANVNHRINDIGNYFVVLPHLPMRFHIHRIFHDTIMSTGVMQTLKRKYEPAMKLLTAPSGAFPNSQSWQSEIKPSYAYKDGKYLDRHGAVRKTLLEPMKPADKAVLDGLLANPHGSILVSPQHSIIRIVTQAMILDYGAGTKPSDELINLANLIQMLYDDKHPLRMYLVGCIESHDDPDDLFRLTNLEVLREEIDSEKEKLKQMRKNTGNPYASFKLEDHAYDFRRHLFLYCHGKANPYSNQHLLNSPFRHATPVSYNAAEESLEKMSPQRFGGKAAVTPDRQLAIFLKGLGGHFVTKEDTVLLTSVRDMIKGARKSESVINSSNDILNEFGDKSKTLHHLNKAIDSFTRDKQQELNYAKIDVDVLEKLHLHLQTRIEELKEQLPRLETRFASFSRQFRSPVVSKATEPQSPINIVPLLATLRREYNAAGPTTLSDLRDCFMRRSVKCIRERMPELTIHSVHKIARLVTQYYVSSILRENMLFLCGKINTLTEQHGTVASLWNELQSASFDAVCVGCHEKLNWPSPARNTADISARLKDLDQCCEQCQSCGRDEPFALSALTARLIREVKGAMDDVFITTEAINSEAENMLRLEERLKDPGTMNFEFVSRTYRLTPEQTKDIEDLRKKRNDLAGDPMPNYPQRRTEPSLSASSESHDFELMKKLNRLDEQSPMHPCDEYVSHVVQRRMAAGKTTVMGTKATAEKADGKTLSVLVILSSLFRSTAPDMQGRTGSFFNIYGYVFQMPSKPRRMAVPDPRNDKNTPARDFLQWTLKGLLMMIETRGYLITTPEALQAFQNSYVEFIDAWAMGTDDNRNAELGRCLNLFANIYHLFRTRGSIIFDEVDSVMRPQKELNYPTMKREHINIHAVQLTADLLLHSAFDETIRASGLSLLANEQSTLTKTQYGMVRNEWRKYVERELRRDESPWRRSFLRSQGYDHSVLDTSDEVLLLLFGPVSDDWLTDPLADPDSKEMSEEEKDLLDAVYRTDKHLFHIVMVMRMQLNGWIRECFKGVVNEHYGPPSENDASLTSKLHMAIPYLAAKMPAEGSVFADRWETVNKTFMMYLVKQIGGRELSEMMDRLRTQVADAKIDSAIEFDVVKAFAELVPGSELRNLQFDAQNRLIDPDGKIATAMRERTRPVFALIFHWILQHVFRPHEFYAEQITANALTMASMFPSKQGYSGTIDNVNVLPWQVLVNAHEDHVLNEKFNGGIALKLMRQSNTIQVIPSVEGFSTLSAALDAMLGPQHADPEWRARFSALIDVGALLKNHANRDVACALAVKFDRPVVLYWDEESGLLHFVRRDSNGAITSAPLERTDPKSVNEATRSTLVDRFTYYDQFHTTGSDILQWPAAMALLTIGPKVLLRDIFQGTMRMRQFMSSQSILVVTTQAVVRLVKDKTRGPKSVDGSVLESVDDSVPITMAHLLFLGAYNEDEKQRAENDRLLRIKIDVELRAFVLNVVTDALFVANPAILQHQASRTSLPSLEDAMTLYTSTRSLFIRDVHEDPTRWVTREEEMEAMEAITGYRAIRTKLIPHNLRQGPYWAQTQKNLDELCAVRSPDGSLSSPALANFLDNHVKQQKQVFSSSPDGDFDGTDLGATIEVEVQLEVEQQVKLELEDIVVTYYERPREEPTLKFDPKASPNDFGESLLSPMQLLYGGLSYGDSSKTSAKRLLLADLLCPGLCSDTNSELRSSRGDCTSRDAVREYCNKPGNGVVGISNGLMTTTDRQKFNFLTMFAREGTHLLFWRGHLPSNGPAGPLSYRVYLLASSEAESLYRHWECVASHVTLTHAFWLTDLQGNEMHGPLPASQLIGSPAFSLLHSIYEEHFLELHFRALLLNGSFNLLLDSEPMYQRFSTWLQAHDMNDSKVASKGRAELLIYRMRALNSLAEETVTEEPFFKAMLVLSDGGVVDFDVLLRKHKEQQMDEDASAYESRSHTQLALLDPEPTEMRVRTNALGLVTVLVSVAVILVVVAVVGRRFLFDGAVCGSSRKGRPAASISTDTGIAG